MNKRLWLVLAWLLVVCALLAHNAYLFAGKRIEPDTDILTLLPVQERDPVLQQAFTHMVDAAQQRVIVLVGADDWPQAVRAADAFNDVIAQRDDLMRASDPVTDKTQGEWLSLFQQHRLNLLTPQQETDLRGQSGEYWVDAAMGKLYSPFGGPKLGAWRDDPFGLFGGWVQARAQETPVRPRDGKLFVADGSRHSVVIPLTLRVPAFSIDAHQAVMPLLAHAREAAEASGQKVDVIIAGVVLHAAAASERANWEVSVIGVGSMVGVILLIWLTFRSFKPILLIMLSIFVGSLGALSVCWLVFDRIHLLTLVFGASLIGVAQDYGIYFLCNRVGAAKEMDSWQLLRRLFPGMFLTFVTTIVGYLALALTPFPGLRQMAVFSSLGLVFAWLTVIFWFPFLVGPNTLKKGTQGQWYKRSVDYWPTAGLNRRTLLAFILFIGFSAFGLSRLTFNDDIRLLQSPRADLVGEQNRMTKLLDTPSPVQFYLVRGETPEDVLQREEMLKRKLDPLIENHTISGYQALSNWIPSSRTQLSNRALVEAKLLSGHGPLWMLGTKINEEYNWAAAMRANLSGPESLMTVDDFLRSPASEAFRHLWLGKVDGSYASVVALRGLSMNNSSIMKGVPQGMEGVQWVDKIDEISSVLGRYRLYMGWVVLLSFGAVYLLLYPRYGKSTWRVLMPTIIASIATLAMLGAAGQNLQLFNMLALMLILGIGVDYGIFMHENTAHNKHSVWLEIGISALSTLLSFGLLALSSTPALQSFGLTMLIGLTLVWLSVPCFSRKETGKAGGAAENE
jgi:predicted exporter